MKVLKLTWVHIDRTWQEQGHKATRHFLRTMSASEWTLPIDRGFTGQVIERGLGLHDYVARHYAQPLGRWIAPDTVVPDPMDPQSLNRYSYVGNRPIVLVDPSGHSACALPHPGIAAGCWVFEKIALYGPQIINLIQQLTIAAPQVPAAVDLASQAGQASQPASSNAGNTADPGGLDPNNWGSKQEQIVRQSLANDYQQVYGASDAEIRHNRDDGWLLRARVVTCTRPFSKFRILCKGCSTRAALRRRMLTCASTRVPAICSDCLAAM